ASSSTPPPAALSLHDALPISHIWLREGRSLRQTQAGQYLLAVANRVLPQLALAESRLRQFAQGERGTLRIGMECHPCYQWLLKVDRKSTRLNSSHLGISYAVF